MITTMKELIAEFAPGASPLDAGVTRTIAKTMKSRGFKRKRMRWQGKVQWVWTNEDRLSALAMRMNDALPRKKK